jgi:hypothetical protein
VTKPKNNRGEDKQDHAKDDCERDSLGEADPQEARSREKVEDNSAKQLPLDTGCQRGKAIHKPMVGGNLPNNPTS